jgi:hypothetical protein
MKNSHFKLLAVKHELVDNCNDRSVAFYCKNYVILDMIFQCHCEIDTGTLQAICILF